MTCQYLAVFIKLLTNYEVFWGCFFSDTMYARRGSVCKPAANPSKQSLANSTRQDTARKQNTILMFYSPQSRINFVTAGVLFVSSFFSLLEGGAFEWVGYLGEIDLS